MQVGFAFFGNFVLVIWKHLLKNFIVYPFNTKSGLLFKKSVVGHRFWSGFDVYFVILYLMVSVTYLFVAMSSLLSTYVLVFQVNIGFLYFVIVTITNLLCICSLQ